MHEHIKKNIKNKKIKTIIGDNGLWWQERKSKRKKKWESDKKYGRYIDVKEVIKINDI